MAQRGEGHRRRLLEAWRGDFDGDVTIAAGSPEEAALAEALEQACDAGRAAWPGVALEDERFVGYLARRAPADVTPTVGLARLERADLYLCCACCAGDTAAQAAFDRRVAPEIDLAVRRVRGAEGFADDVRQLLRQRYLVPSEDRPPRLVQYSGQGSLNGWVRVAAVREASRLLRRAGRELPLETQRLAVAAGAEDDLELGYLKKVYRAEFRQAFAAALAALAPRDRNLLRYRYLDDLNIDELGAIHGVHRATAARWLVAIRQQLLERTRSELAARLAVGAAEVESVMRLIHSQLPVSIVAHLGSDEPADQ